MTITPKAPIRTQDLTRDIPRKIFLSLAVILLAIFCLAPVLWQVLTSVKVNQDIAAVPSIYFPTRFTLSYLPSIRFGATFSIVRLYRLLLQCYLWRSERPPPMH